MPVVPLWAPSDALPPPVSLMPRFERLLPARVLVEREPVDAGGEVCRGVRDASAVADDLSHRRTAPAARDLARSRGVDVSELEGLTEWAA